MSAHDRDPVNESLDRLAGLADDHAVGDRLPDIQRRARVARRRRTAAAGVTAAAVVAAGLGLWQLLPREDDGPDPTPPAPELAQTVTIDATPLQADLVRVSFTVTGRSSAWTDPATGEPMPAGPHGVELWVDGRREKRFGEPAGGCEAGGEVSSYSRTFPADRDYQAFVAGPGDHTVEVRSRWCSDGEVVDEPTRVTVATEADPPTVLGVRADVDGDGSADVVRLVVPADSSHAETMELRVRWGSGGTATLELPFDGYARRPQPLDLDGDGGQEVVLESSGGDSRFWKVVHAVDGGLEVVREADAAGGGAGLASTCTECGGGPQNRTWVTTLTSDGFVAYRFVDPQPVIPAAVTVRRWRLVGDTITLLAPETAGCLHRTQDGVLDLTTGGC